MLSSLCSSSQDSDSACISQASQSIQQELYPCPFIHVPQQHAPVCVPISKHFPTDRPSNFLCTHFHFHSCPMINLVMKAQIAIVPCSVFTLSTITFRLFMHLLHMIHRSVGHFIPKFTFIAELPFSNRILKLDLKINYSTMLQLIQAPAIFPSHPSLQL